MHISMQAALAEMTMEDLGDIEDDNDFHVDKGECEVGCCMTDTN
jgi:hypothetical protein